MRLTGPGLLTGCPERERAMCGTGKSCRPGVGGDGVGFRANRSGNRPSGAPRHHRLRLLAETGVAGAQYGGGAVVDLQFGEDA